MFHDIISEDQLFHTSNVMYTNTVTSMHCEKMLLCVNISKNSSMIDFIFEFILYPV